MMTKFLPAALATLIITGMSIFTAVQFNTIDEQGVTIVEQVEEIQELELSLANELEMNDQLRSELVLLRDSIALLKNVIKDLEHTIRKQNKTIKTIKAKLKDIENQYTALKMEIANLARKDEVDKELIASLEADKAELRNEIVSLNQQKDQEITARTETEAELLDRQVSEARFKRITNLVNNTKVRFNRIALTKKRFGKPINKIKDNNTKWKYTEMEFYLEHNDLKLLLDEQFLVKIINADTGEALSYIENNPNFPDSEIDSKGIAFRYDGNMIELSYYNNQDKTGNNYEVQIYYISNGEEYLLLDGAVPFIQDRKVVKL
jgi:peptidoglycan hydrolase CwlO-like protein